MVPVLGERAQRDLLELEKVCSRIYRPRVSNTQGHAGCALLLFHQHDPFKHSSTFLLISLHPVGFCKIGPTHRMSHFKCYRKEKKRTFWRAVSHSYLSQIKHGAAPALSTGHVGLLHDTGSLFRLLRVFRKTTPLQRWRPATSTSFPHCHHKEIF